MSLFLFQKPKNSLRSWEPGIRKGLGAVFGLPSPWAHFYLEVSMRHSNLRAFPKSPPEKDQLKEDVRLFLELFRMLSQHRRSTLFGIMSDMATVDCMPREVLVERLKKKFEHS